MKVAVVTDDMDTISAHFGRARHYLVYHVEEGVVRGKEVRDKVGHGPGTGDRHGHHAGPEMVETHNAMLSNVKDCDVVISRGMGRPMYEAIKDSGMKVFITQKQYADEAIKALIDGSLDSHLELLH